MCEEICVDPERFGPGADIAERCLGAFFHHVAQLAGEGVAFGAWQPCRLKKGDISSCFGPDQPDGHAWVLQPFFDLLVKKPSSTQIDCHVFVAHHPPAFDIPGSDAGGDFAAHLADLAFQVADPGLARVALNDFVQGIVGKTHFGRAQPVLFDLSGHQIALGDVDFFVFGVAAQLDDLHAVAQGWWDCVQHVGGGDKEHLAQIEGNIQVVVAKFSILFGVEHFEQRAAGVSPKIPAQLVDFVEHEDWVAAFHAPQVLDDAAGHCPNIGAPEAADIGLVAHPAQGKPDKFAVHGPGNAQPQAGFADPRWADKAEHQPLAFAANLVADGFSAAALSEPSFSAQLADRQKFQNSFLDLGEPIVVFVEHRACVFDVQIVDCAVAPGQADHQVQVGLDHAVLGGLDRHAPHPCQLAQRLAFGLFAHSGGCDSFFQFSNVRGMLVFFAQLFLDRTHLLAQKELTLHPFHFALCLRLDFAPQFEHFNFFFEQLDQAQQFVAHPIHLEHRLGIFQFEAHAAGHQVGQLAAILDVDRHDGQFVGHLGFEVDQSAEEILDGPHQRLHLQPFFLGLGQNFDARPQEGAFLRELQEPDAFEPLHEQPHGAVGGFEDSVHLGCGADRVDFVGGGFVQIFIFAGDEGDDAVVGQGFFDQSDAALLSDRQRQPHHRVDDDPAQRQHGQVVGDDGFRLSFQDGTLLTKFF